MSYALIAFAIAQYHSFRVRGVLAEVLVYGALGLAGIGLVTLAVQGILASGLGGATLHLALVSVSALPIAIVLGLKALAPSIEQ